MRDRAARADADAFADLDACVDAVVTRALGGTLESDSVRRNGDVDVAEDARAIVRGRMSRWVDVWEATGARVARRAAEIVDARECVEREVLERVCARVEALERAVREMRERLEERTRERDEAREALGREIVARGAREEGEGDDVVGFGESERLRNECELYREACRRYRKRAEHYEALYRESRAGAGTRATGVVVRETQFFETDVASRRPATEDERAPARARLRPAAFEDDSEERALRRKFKRATRDARAENPNRRYEDELWGAPTQRTAERPRDDDDGGDDLAARGERKRSGDERGAPPLDRIFLDSKNTRRASGETVSTSGDDSHGNKVRKNKRLSDNAPRAPDAVHGEGSGKPPRVVKHVEVVRNKSAREALDAYVCEECRTFYDAMMPDKDCSTIKCPHAPKEGTTKSAAPNGRHRAKWAPEPAPRGFWNLALTPPEGAPR